MPLVEGTGYWYGKHSGVTVAHMPQEERISGIAPCSKYDALYACILVGMKEAQTWVDNYRIENTTLHTFDILLNNNKDKGKGWLWECLPKKVRGEDTGNHLNPL